MARGVRPTSQGSTVFLSEARGSGKWTAVSARAKPSWQQEVHPSMPEVATLRVTRAPRTFMKTWQRMLGKAFALAPVASYFGRGGMASSGLAHARPRYPQPPLQRTYDARARVGAKWHTRGTRTAVREGSDRGMMIAKRERRDRFPSRSVSGPATLPMVGRGRCSLPLCEHPRACRVDLTPGGPRMGRTGAVPKSRRRPPRGFANPGRPSDRPKTDCCARGGLAR